MKKIEHPFPNSDTWKKDLADSLRINAKKFRTYPSLEVMNNLFRYIETSNYTMMIFAYGEEYVRFCLAYFQSVEDYERCAVIVRKIRNFNMTEGTWIETTIE